MLRWRFRIRLGKKAGKRTAIPAEPAASARTDPAAEDPPASAALGGSLREIRLPTAPEPVESREPDPLQLQEEAAEPEPVAAEARSPGEDVQAAAAPVEAAATPIPGIEEKVLQQEVAAEVEAEPEAEVEVEPEAEVEVEPEAEPEEADESAPLPAPAPLVGVACPNCGHELESRPLGQSPCPHCSRTIHVRARQAIFRGGLVGEADVDAVDFLESVEPFGIQEADCRRRLEQRPGAPLSQVLWELCEARVAALPEARRGRLLEEMAMFRRFRGEEFVSLRRQAAAAQLRRLEQEGVARVRVGARGGDCCPGCAPLLGQELAPGEALERGLLPAAGCSRPDGLCRCVYLPA